MEGRAGRTRMVSYHLEGTAEMFTDADMMLDRVHDYQHDAIAEVDRYRLLAAARRVRRSRKARHHDGGRPRG